MSTADPGRGCLVGAASARRWISWWRACARGRAGRWFCAARPASARPRCWSTWWGARRDAASRAPRAWSRRWSSRSPGCISCARRSLDRLDRLPGPQRDALGTAFGLRERRRAGPVPRRPRGAEPAVRRGRGAAAGLCRSTMRSGSTAPRRRRSRSSRAGWGPSRSGWSSPCATRPASRTWRAGGALVGGLTTATRGRCWRPCWPVRSTSACATGSWPRPAATRWRCWSCRAAGRRTSWRAGSALAGALALSGRIEESFQQRLAALPPATRLLLLVAAAEPVGDPLLLWRAAAALGNRRGRGGARGRRGPGRARRPGALPPSARALGGVPGGRAGGAPARPPRARRRHRSRVDPDRRAWHRAQATPGLDEDVAAELERSAGRAQARGGLAAGGGVPRARRRADARPGPPGAARARRGAEQAPGRRARRGAAAARPSPRRGRWTSSSARGRSCCARRSRSRRRRGRDAPPLLLEAAKRLEPLDAALARETYLDAFAAALSAGRLARGGDAREVAAAVLAADWAPSLARVAARLRPAAGRARRCSPPRATPPARRR